MKYFISGHTNLTKEEFNKNYKEKLDSIIHNEKDYTFIIGNSNGADLIALKYLLNNGCNPKLITIYYMDNINDRNENYYINLGLNIIKGFTSYDKRDSLMTKNSDLDIGWIRSPEENKKLLESIGEKFRKNRISGTEKNLLRRKKIDNI
jgi:hypothetical protein